MASKVEICGVNTSKLPRYRDREMQEMLEAIKAGDERMRDEFIRGNLRLVLSVIQKFSTRGENPDDLFQVGCVGLIKALNNFDLSHGVKFSTCAVPMIVGEVRRYLRDNNSIRVSRSVRDTAYRALTAREHLGRQLQREPTVDEIARELELPREDVVLALDAIQDPVSLLKNTDAKWIENLSLSEAMKKLSPREQHILTMRFFEGKTQMEVAGEIAISQAQVSRLEKNALKYMKKYIL